MNRFFLRSLPLWLAAWFFVSLPVLYAQSESDWAYPGDNVEETEGRGLVIRSEPTGATVFIDGLERGKTPLRLENLRPGRYHIRVEKDGYTERRFRVSVRQGSLTDVSVGLKEAVGRVLLRIRRQEQRPSGQEPLPLTEARPLDPKVSVDGQAYPQFSFGEPALELPVGFRTILVRAFGWEDASTTLYIEEDSFKEVELSLTPAAFRLQGARLSRGRFNPGNAGSLGTTVFNFDVTAPGTASLTVLDAEGKAVFTRALSPFETWAQSVVWDGRNAGGKILDDGVYTLMIKAVPGPGVAAETAAAITENLSLNVEIDSSRVIHPLTLSSGKAGLLFAPLPALLPPGAFQVEGSFLAGAPPPSAPPGTGGAWKSLPFAAAARFSPLERLEVSAALNVIPFFGEKAAAGIAGGAKWVFLNSAAGSSPSAESSPLGAAAGAAFSWTGKTGTTPFGMAPGIEVFFPFSLSLGRIFSFALTPAALWTSDEGFPWDGAPRLLVSGGLLARFTYVTAGLSIRTEYNFSRAPRTPSIMAGAEVKIFPPPSSFVISVMGGVWKNSDGAGGFGGLGIGMIH